MPGLRDMLHHASKELDILRRDYDVGMHFMLRGKRMPFGDHLTFLQHCFFLLGDYDVPYH